MEHTMLMTHYVVVILFLLIYLVKTVLLLTNKQEQLAKFSKTVRVPEMIVSFLFLATGIYLLVPMIKADRVSSLLIIKIIAVLASIPLAVVGFRKQNKGLALIAFLLIVAAFGLGEVVYKQMGQPANTNTETAPEGLVLDGQKIYSDNCSKCHGDDGKAGILGATDLSASTADAAAKTAVVKNGRNTMPAFSGQLSDQQIDAVVGYIETLKK